jgi:hypothetical protein
MIPHLARPDTTSALTGASSTHLDSRVTCKRRRRPRSITNATPSKPGLPKGQMQDSGTEAVQQVILAQNTNPLGVILVMSILIVPQSPTFPRLIGRRWLRPWSRVPLSGPQKKARPGVVEPWRSRRAGSAHVIRARGSSIVNSLTRLRRSTTRSSAPLLLRPIENLINALARIESVRNINVISRLAM